jgi:hypothetical protein
VSTATPAPLPGNLAVLAELDNMDKHRVVQSVWHQTLCQQGRGLTTDSACMSGAPLLCP